MEANDRGKEHRGVSELRHLGGACGICISVSGCSYGMIPCLLLVVSLDGWSKLWLAVYLAERCCSCRNWRTFISQ